MAESLYIHIPFCVRKCIYCDFVSVPYDDSIASLYAEALCRELRMRRDSGPELKTIYVGGGTPSIMPDAFFGQLFSCIGDVYRVSSSAEITVEANPGTITEPKIAVLLSIGVDRISIGVQSLHDEELRTLGRIHTSAQALSSVKMAGDLGFRNISVDLMYGIPGQTLDTWAETLRKAIQLGPSHISAYELTPEERTPLYGLLKSGSLELPDEELVISMYDLAIDMLSSSGYEHYEISNFSRQGFRCLHNMNYWDRGEYLAAGAGAHSFLKGIRRKNISDVRTYIARLQKGLAYYSETEVARDESVKEFIFLGLRKREGIDLKDPILADTDIASGSESLVDRGYIEIANDHLNLTKKGLLISNSVLVELFERLNL